MAHVTLFTADGPPRDFNIVPYEDGQGFALILALGSCRLSVHAAGLDELAALADGIHKAVADCVVGQEISVSPVA